MNKKVFKLIALILSLTTFICLLPLGATATTDGEEMTYSTGLIWDDTETIDSLLVEGAGGVNTKKTFVDLTDKFPTPGYQGNQNSCVGWAIAYLKSGQENIKRGWSVTNTAHQFSPSFIYNQLNGGMNSGINISRAMQFVANSGVCSINYFPYEEGNYTKQPSGIAKAAAALYKANNVITLEGVQAIKNHIANENSGVIIGVEVYSDLYLLSSLNPIYNNTLGKKYPGGHAICLIGFDDSKQAFKFINSWGTGWGLGGYGWISYDLVANPIVNQHTTSDDVCVGFAMGRATDDYILGDINGDGKISVLDSKLVLNHIAGNATLTNRQFALADVNGDAKITIVDSKSILRYVAGEISKMPLYD